MGFARLQALENELSSLQSKLSSYSTQLDDQNKRHTDIESLLKDMQDICSNRSSDINVHLDKMINNYEDSIRGIQSAQLLYLNTKSDKEKNTSDDLTMNEALYYLKQELNDVQLKIDSLKSSISATQNQISNCQAEIRSEKRRIANGFWIKYNDAQMRVNRADSAYKADPASSWLKQEYDKACLERDIARDNYNNYKGWL